MNIQDWFPLALTGLISLLSKGLSRVFSNTTVQKVSILPCSAFFMVQLSHPYMTTGKTIALTRWTLVGKVNSSSYPPSKKQNLIFHKEVLTLWDPQGHTVLHPSQVNTSLWTQWSLPLGMEHSRTHFLLIQSSLLALSTGQCILVFSTLNATTAQGKISRKWNEITIPSPEGASLAPSVLEKRVQLQYTDENSAPLQHPKGLEYSGYLVWLQELDFC